jgi:hypothetical protein
VRFSICVALRLRRLNHFCSVVRSRLTARFCLPSFRDLQALAQAVRLRV